MDLTEECAWCGTLRLREFTVVIDGPERVCRDRITCQRRRDRPTRVRHRTIRLTPLGERVADALE